MNKLFLVLDSALDLEGGEIGTLPQQFYMAPSAEQALEDYLTLTYRSRTDLGDIVILCPDQENQMVYTYTYVDGLGLVFQTSDILNAKLADNDDDLL